MSIKLQALICKELKEYLTTSLFYLLSAMALGVLGWFFFNQLILTRENPNTPSENILLIPFFGNLNFITLFLTPLLTMKSLSSELKDGTFEILTQSHLSVLDIVLGKSISLVILVLLFILLSCIFPIMMAQSTQLYWPHVLIGLLGVFLQTCAYISLGLLCSTLSYHPSVCAFMTIASILFFMILSGAGINWEAFGLTYHFEYFIQGILRPNDLLYYLSFIFFMLYLTVLKLKTRPLFS